MKPTKRKKSSQKGSTFERKICTELSLWWAKKEDVFWRSSGSGARATGRRKKGKSTCGQDGDIAAIDPVGLPLLKMFTFELKKGYNKASIMDLLDASKQAKSQTYQDWMKQAQDSHRGKSLYWSVIFQRDRREILMMLPSSAYDDLIRYTIGPSINSMPLIEYYFRNNSSIVLFQFQHFLKYITPETIQMILDNEVS